MADNKCCKPGSPEERAHLALGHVLGLDGLWHEDPHKAEIRIERFLLGYTTELLVQQNAEWWPEETEEEEDE